VSCPRRIHTDFVFSSHFKAGWTQNGGIGFTGRVRFFPVAMPPSSFSRAVGGDSEFLHLLWHRVPSKEGAGEAKRPQHILLVEVLSHHQVSLQMR